MPYDLIIIGAGLAGLFAGCLAARRGKQTLLLARGLGSTHLSSGTIGVCVGDKSALATQFSTTNHPYGLVGRKALKAALEEFKMICAEAGYPMHGELGKNFKLPTAAGSQRQACLIPETMLVGDLERPEPFTLGNLPGFRDFNASLALANLSRDSACAPAAIDLPLPQPLTQREAYATDLAHLFDREDYRDEVIARWKPLLADCPGRLGLPAVLGLEKAMEAKAQLEATLERQLFEIPILPPSVPGMRLFNLLRDDFQTHGGRLMMGLVVSGSLEKGNLTITANANGRATAYRADTVILATGGFLNGGLVAEFEGRIRESVFDLAIPAPMQRAAWTSELFFGPHPFAKFGVLVNKSMQPLNTNGKLIAGNLRAVGSILAGADRLSEGSREGIELGTAWRAIETLA